MFLRIFSASLIDVKENKTLLQSCKCVLRNMVQGDPCHFIGIAIHCFDYIVQTPNIEDIHNCNVQLVTKATMNC